MCDTLFASFLLLELHKEEYEHWSEEDYDYDDEADEEDYYLEDDDDDDESGDLTSYDELDSLICQCCQPNGDTGNRFKGDPTEEVMKLLLQN